MVLCNTIHGAPARKRAGALLRTIAARRGGRTRRGATSWAGILTVAALGGAGVGAVVLTPRVIIATGGGGLAAPPAIEWPVQPEHRLVLERLAALIAGSHGVLAVYDRGDESPLFEIVLWVEDSAPAGVIDAGEIALIAHSRLLETIRLFALPEGREAPALSESDIASEGFGALWRDDVRVGARTLATGVAEMRLEPAGAGAGGMGLSRLSLIWSPVSTDQADAGAVLLDALPATWRPAE